MTLNICPLLGTERLNGKATPVLLVEGGEKAIEEAAAAGWTAVSGCGHGDHLPSDLHRLKARPVTILSNDPDKANPLIEALIPLTKDLHLAFGTVDDLQSADDYVAEYRRRFAEKPAATRARFTCMADVKDQAVEWLWRDHLPRGTLVTLDGDPGLGKSTITLDWTARVTTGKPWPDGQPCTPGAVIVMGHEDSKAKTIRPRLEAAGADTNRVFHFDAVETDDGLPRQPFLPADIGHLRDRVIGTGARLVIVDPLFQYLTGNTYKDQEVRQALAPLAQMAEETGCTVVVVRHPTKDTTKAAIHRGGGSVGIAGAARCCLMVVPDPDDSSRRLLTSTKNNLGPKPSSRFFDLIEDPGLKVASVVWGDTDPRSADDLLAPAPDRTDGSEAAKWLTEYLAKAGGSASAAVIKSDGKAAGFSASALDRAKKRIKAKSRKAEMDGGWDWAAEGTTPTPITPDPVPSVPSEEMAAWDREADPMGLTLVKPMAPSTAEIAAEYRKENPDWKERVRVL